MKVRFNSDDDLPLKKTVELHNIIIVVRSNFHVEKINYRKVFLGEYLHKLKMLECDRIEMSEGIGVNKTSGLQEYYKILFDISGTFSK